MFLAMASSILSASTFDVPLLRYLRKCMSCFISPKEPSAWMLRFILKTIPSSVRIRSKSSCLYFRNVLAMEYSKDQFNCPVEATLFLIGGKYKPLILWYLIEKPLLYMELQRMIPSPAIRKPCFSNSARVGIRLEKVLLMVNPLMPFSLSTFHGNTSSYCSPIPLSAGTPGKPALSVLCGLSGIF